LNARLLLAFVAATSTGCARQAGIRRPATGPAPRNLAEQTVQTTARPEQGGSEEVDARVQALRLHVDAAEDLERDSGHALAALLTEATDLEVELAEQWAMHAKVVTELDRLDSEVAEVQASVDQSASGVTEAIEGQKVRTRSLRERDAHAVAGVEDLRAFERSLKPLIDSQMVRVTTRGRRIVVALPRAALLGTGRPPRATTSATNGILTDVVRALREHGWGGGVVRREDWGCRTTSADGVGFTVISYYVAGAADRTRAGAAADAAAILDALALLDLPKRDMSTLTKEPNPPTGAPGSPASMTDWVEIVVDHCWRPRPVPA
jgi:hypothetical protein